MAKMTLQNVAQLTKVTNYYDKLYVDMFAFKHVLFFITSTTYARWMHAVFTDICFIVFIRICKILTFTVDALYLNIYLFIYLISPKTMLDMTYARHINTDGRYTFQLSPTTTPYKTKPQKYIKQLRLEMEINNWCISIICKCYEWENNKLY